MWRGMVEPLDEICGYEQGSQGSALEGHLETCKLFDHDDEQHNDGGPDFVLNLNGENILIAKGYEAVSYTWGE